MDQDNQKTSGIEQSQAGGFDEGVFDELWDVAIKTSTEKKSEGGSSPLPSFGSLDWGDLENDNDLWNGLEAEALTKQKVPSEEETASVTADKAHDIAKSLFSDGDEIVVSHRSKPVEAADGNKRNSAEITVRVRASSILNDVEKAVAEEKDSLDTVTQTSMASVADIGSYVLADDPFESSSIVDVTEKSDKTEDSSASEKKSDDLEDVGGIFDDVVVTDEKAEDSENIAEDSEAKSEDTEAKSEDTEAKSEDTEAKSEDTEAKSEDTEAKSEDTEAKSEDTEAKSEDTEAKAEESEETDSDADLSVKSLLAEESDEEVSEGEVDESDDGGVILSERARMGRFIPEGEVISADHELKADTYYEDEICEPETVDEVSSGEHRGLILLCAVLLSILVGVVIYAIYVYATKPADIIYAQQTVFMDDIGAYQRITTSADGRYVVMCSDSRGIVRANGKKVSEFWPSETGCRDIRVSDDGKHVWFVGRDNSLYEVNLEKEYGFNAVKLGTLEGRYMDGFDVAGNKVVYAALADDGFTRVIRTLDLQTKQAVDQKLPADSFICNGVFTEGYTYISEGAVHTVRNNKTESASLDSPKLGCAQPPSQKACTSDRDGNWAVLCTNSIRQGKGKSAEAAQQLPDDPAIRSGAKKFLLLRNSAGTDFIATDYMYSIDKSNNLKHAEFSTKLNESFAAVRLNKESVLAINGRAVVSVNGEGIVSPLAYLSQTQIIGTEFVSDGNRLAVFALSGTGTQVNLWSLNEAALLRTQDISGIVNSVNVSEKGHYGFVVANDNGKSVLHWMEWNTIHPFASIALSREVTDSVWSDDEKYALLKYEDKSWELYERGENGMRLMRSYPAGVLLAFAQNGMLWRIENGHLMNEQIGTGNLSVIYNALDASIEEFDIQGVVAHPHANDVILWGNKGLLTLKLEGASRRALSVSLEKPVTWCVPDRYGKYAATSVGLFDLENAVIYPYNTQSDIPLSWVGTSNYLMNADGSVMLDVSLPEQIKTISMARKNIGLDVIGSNSGFHPSANLISVIRDGAVSVEMLNNNASASTMAVFAGRQDKWCWANTDGQKQGVGGLCTTVAQKENVTVLASNPSVVDGMKANVQKITPVPAFAQYDLKFVDEVDLSINTIPAESFLVFSTEGDLPEGLVFEDGAVAAPLSTKVKRDSREFTVYATADGYQTRVVSFKPEMAKLNLRIPLQPEAASNIATVWFDNDEDAENEEITLSEDTNIEFNALVFENKDEIKRCMGADGVIQLDLNAQSEFVVSEGTDEAQAACLAPFLTKVQEARQNGALPELSDMINVRAVTVIL